MNIQGFDTVASFTASHQDAFKASLVATLSHSVPEMSTDQIDLSISLAGGRRLSSGSGSGVTVGFTIADISSSELSSTATAIHAVGRESSFFMNILEAAMVVEGAAVPDGMGVLVPTPAPAERTAAENESEGGGGGVSGGLLLLGVAIVALGLLPGLLYRMGWCRCFSGSSSNKKAVYMERETRGAGNIFCKYCTSHSNES
jgi:hypothetical protein